MKKLFALLLLLSLAPAAQAENPDGAPGLLTLEGGLGTMLTWSETFSLYGESVQSDVQDVTLKDFWLSTTVPVAHFMSFRAGYTYLRSGSTIPTEYNGATYLVNDDYSRHSLWFAARFHIACSKAARAALNSTVAVAPVEETP